MNRDEKLKIKTEENMQVILELLSKCKSGLHASDLADLTGLTLRQCAKILTMLRDQGKVSQLGTRKEWIKGKKYNPLHKDLYEEQQRWRDQVRAKKIKYNPWGQGNATN